jgi:DNA ligase-1
VLLRELVAASADVERTRSRNAKVERLAACLRGLGEAELRPAVHWLAGALRQGRIGLGPAALAEAAAAPPAARDPLEIAEVDRAFDALAAGADGSARERGRRLGALFARADEAERDFLARLVRGELRQGASEGLVAEAIAAAFAVPAAAVRRALMLSGDLGAVAEAARRDGATGLARFSLRLFQPVLPMLAQTAEDVGDALARLGEAALEPKLDGARVQVHKRGDEVRVYSRGQLDVTPAVPEIVAAARALPARELVADGEALALRADATPQPFQITMRRFGRRLDVERMRAEIPLSCFLFDCLHLDGETLLERPGAERARALAEAVPDAVRVPRLVTSDAAVAAAFLRDTLAQGHEGVMAKSLAAPYAAGQRGAAWLKLKAVHSLDLVVLAAEWGSGRRRGWLSNLHLGARDPERGGFVMLGKTFKGLTDELLRWQTARLLELELGRDAHTVYVRPELVVEIAAGGVQASPQYPGGVALRFARVKRYRPDKRADEADTLAAVHAIWQAEARGAGEHGSTPREDARRP